MGVGEATKTTGGIDGAKLQQMEGSTGKVCEVTACLRVEGGNCDVSELEQQMRTTNKRSKSEVESIKRTSCRRRRRSMSVV